MKSNKKFLQFIAAFLILIFHVCIPVTNGTAELFILRTGYVGVDIFFFLSAYSIAGREINYSEFLKNRFLKIYGKYVVLVLIAAIYKSMSIPKLVNTLFMTEFFQKGGGAFLWFVPAILIFYLIFPLFHKWNNRYKILIALICWFVLSFVIVRLTGYTKLMIFTNRIPAILAGYGLGSEEGPLAKLPKWSGILLFIPGEILLYFFGFRYKLNVPFMEIYFVLGLLVVVAFYSLSFYIKPYKIWNYLGSGTLELYGLSMIFGPKLVTTIYKQTGNIIITNICTVVIMYAMAFLLERLFHLISTLAEKKSNASKSEAN